MPVHFHPTGIIVVDTVTEAVQFEQQRSSPKPKAKRGRLPKIPRRDGWDGFYTSLQGLRAFTARKVLALVKGRSDLGITIEELAEGIGKSPAVIGGTISGIGKKGSMFGLDPSEVLVRSEDGLIRPGKLLADNQPPTP